MEKEQKKCINEGWTGGEIGWPHWKLNLHRHRVPRAISGSYSPSSCSSLWLEFVVADLRGRGGGVKVVVVVLVEEASSQRQTGVLEWRGRGRGGGGAAARQRKDPDLACVALGGAMEGEGEHEGAANLPTYGCRPGLGPTDCCLSWPLLEFAS